MITVAQALHWFDMEAFYDQCRKAAKPDGTTLVAAWTYCLPSFPPQYAALEQIMIRYYSDILGTKYWDAKRKIVEDQYRSIPWPFEPIFHNGVKTSFIDDFAISLQWDAQKFIGYLRSWSATQSFIDQHRESGTTVALKDATRLSSLLDDREFSPLSLIELDVCSEWPGMDKREGYGETVQVTYPVFVRVGRVLL